MQQKQVPWYLGNIHMRSINNYILCIYNIYIYISLQDS